jgi:6-phosphogluconolactonase
VSNVELVVHDDAEAAARAAGELLADAAVAGAHIALSGGSAPGPAHEHAARVRPSWRGVHVWWGDDRCVPPDDERSNFRLARETLLAHLSEQPDVHRIQGELDPEEAAARYDEELEGVTLTFALNGIGPDGHTASLFPNADALDERMRRAVAADPQLEPFVPRVTMTPPVFAAAELLVYLVVGPGKTDAIRRAFGGDTASPATPASLVRGRRTMAILDAAAAAALDN